MTETDVDNLIDPIIDIHPKKFGTNNDLDTFRNTLENYEGIQSSSRRKQLNLAIR